VEQFGLINRIQALACGMSPAAIGRRTASGNWTRVLPNVYRLPGAPSTWHGSLMAATLWLKGDCAISHQAAAALWKLDGFPPCNPIVSTTRHVSSTSVDVRRVSNLSAADLTAVNGIPVTSVGRTLVDLGNAVGLERLEDAVESALRKNLTTASEIARAAARRGGRGVSGSKAFGACLARLNETHQPTRSVLEQKMQRLLAHSGLPAMEREYRIALADRVFFLDFCYPEVRVAVEVEGWQWHSGRRKWQKDLERRNLLTGAGWLILHFTWSDVCERPGWVASQIARAVSLRSVSR
jgi:very-short-patch-repair endonuclease